ncbi:hypothetical protein CYV15_09910 [Riemerella anatipestifer]|nr:hypothetical protein [Riemerella anatipestifer]MSN91400.1 hypothetical protein [Riemerella anatipestifer]OBP47195.1 hypothetical protein AWM65_09525 [Riemerella anatipestifer]OBP51159.1 hypothetical protein AWM66_09570 [Riemerella anatipestifer]PST43470.1 hypothetical protein CYV15_09910 [Riemerella anatipestifer]
MSFSALSIVIGWVVLPLLLTVRVLPKAGTSQHPTSTEIPHLKGKQIFLKCKYPPLAAIPCWRFVLFVRAVK